MQRILTQGSPDNHDRVCSWSRVGDVWFFAPAGLAAHIMIGGGLVRLATYNELRAELASP